MRKPSFCVKSLFIFFNYLINLDMLHKPSLGHHLLVGVTSFLIWLEIFPGVLSSSCITIGVEMGGTHNYPLR